MLSGKEKTWIEVCRVSRMFKIPDTMIPGCWTTVSHADNISYLCIVIRKSHRSDETRRQSERKPSGRQSRELLNIVTLLSR